MTQLKEPALDTSLEALEELFEAPAYAKGYRLVLLDDDVTPMDFVVLALVKVFAFDVPRAAELMLYIHQNGRGDVFKGSLEECEAKKNELQLLNESYGYHLFLLLEKVD